MYGRIQHGSTADVATSMRCVRRATPSIIPLSTKCKIACYTYINSVSPVSYRRYPHQYSKSTICISKRCVSGQKHRFTTAITAY